MRTQLSMRASTSSANISSSRAAGSVGGACAGRRRRLGLFVEMPERCSRIRFLRRSQREAFSAAVDADSDDGGVGEQSAEQVEEAGEARTRALSACGSALTLMLEHDASEAAGGEFAVGGAGLCVYAVDAL